MNALAHYALLLAKRDVIADDERSRLIGEAKVLYGRLEEVDVDRKERYRDMGES